ncbi:MAG: helix-turn-helix domain-containing protein [Spirochaetales bacterium]|nr:helix-turn-helix domain-containing protein [Spirochaetales bacterium]
MEISIKNHLTHSDVFADSAFPLSVLRRTPQAPFPSHTHDFSELVIVYGGKGIHFTDDEEYSVSSGDVFVIQGSRAHGYRQLEDLMLINIIYDDINLPFPKEDLLDLKGYHALFTWEPRLRHEHNFQSRLRLSHRDLAEALKQAELMEKETELKLDGYRFICLALFMQLCGFLSRHYDTSKVPQMKDLSRISGVLSFLEQNTDRFVSISEITEFSAMSESTVLRLFNKTTGFSPIEYHSRLRIQKVCHLLSTTSKTITEIAFDTGYGDSNYLSRQFKKIMGMAPRDYR